MNSENSIYWKKAYKYGLILNKNFRIGSKHKAIITGVFLCKSIFMHLSFYFLFIQFKVAAPSWFSVCRCLRVIFQSWQIFVDYTIPKNLINESYHKRQRISTDEDNLRGEEQPSSSVSFVTDEYIPRKHKSRSLSNSVNLHPFGNAKECILLLKKTLEDLHRKDLFPYNPKPLLRRFAILMFYIFIFWIFTTFSHTYLWHLGMTILNEWKLNKMRKDMHRCVLFFFPLKLIVV